jgi:hypothetical protein
MTRIVIDGLVLVLLVTATTGCVRRWCGLPLEITPAKELMAGAASALMYYPTGSVAISDHGVPFELAKNPTVRGAAHTKTLPGGCLWCAGVKISDHTPEKQLPSLIAHEIGHLLGLPDIDEPDCIMESAVKPWAEWCAISAEILNRNYGWRVLDG